MERYLCTFVPPDKVISDYHFAIFKYTLSTNILKIQNLDLKVVKKIKTSICGFGVLNKKLQYKRYGYYTIAGKKYIRVCLEHAIDASGAAWECHEGVLIKIMNQNVVNIDNCYIGHIILDKFGDIYFHSVKLNNINHPQAIKCIWIPNAECHCKQYATLLDDGRIIFRQFKWCACYHMWPKPVTINIGRGRYISEYTIIKIAEFIHDKAPYMEPTELHSRFEEEFISKDQLCKTEPLVMYSPVKLPRYTYIKIAKLAYPNWDFHYIFEELLSKESLTYYQLAKIHMMIWCSPVKLPKFLYIKIIELIWPEYKIF